MWHAARADFISLIGPRSLSAVCEEVMMTKSMVSACATLVIFVLLSACDIPIGEKHGASSSREAPDQAEQISPVETARVLSTSTIVPTPSVPIEKGKGEIKFSRVMEFSDAMGGVYRSKVDATIPFEIIFSKKRSVWETKGTSMGKGNMEFKTSKPSKIECKATYEVSLSLTGIVVPFSKTGADGGCYIDQAQIMEDWGIEEASCSTHLGTAEGIFESETTTIDGPYRYDLIEGKDVNQLSEQGGVKISVHSTIQNLNVPQSIGCIPGMTIEQSK